jgi:serine/threonine protein kinase
VASAPDVAGLVDLVEIGRGGFGVVYRALEQDLERPVAVKVLFGQLDDVSRRRFERERRAMGKISGHPHVVTVYRTGMTGNGQPFIVMELMEGGSMRDRVRADGPVPWAEAVRIGVDIASALDEAHRAGIRHRDIKPGNLLVSARGVVKLADFGIALISGGPETQSSVVTASLAHAAPEVLAGRRPDERSDIYSLGSTLYELLRGQAAFVRDDDESLIPLLTRIARDTAPSLTGAGVPRPLSDVIEQAMAKDPADRPQSAADLQDALRRARDTATATARDTAQATTLLGPDALAPPRIGPAAAQAGTSASTSATDLRTRRTLSPPESPGGSRLSTQPDPRGTRILAIVLAIGTLTTVALIGWLTDRRAPDQTGASEAPSVASDDGPLVADDASEVLDPAGTSLAGATDTASVPPDLTDYDTYVPLTDNDGVISIEVPTAWSDVQATSRQIAASERLSGFYYSYDDSGAAVTVSSPAGSDPDQVLDGTQEADCVEVERGDYDDGILTGRYDTWTGCGAAQTTAVVHLALVPADNSDYLITASIQLTELRDFLAAERFLSSLVVDPSAL